MVDRLHMLLSDHARPGIALLTALLVLAATIGIPLPQPVAKDTSRPFPCMHHACGCHTAESCWRGCCCLSDEQKLAWAAEHHVTPPEDFTRRLAAERTCCSHDDCKKPAAERPTEHGQWHVVRIDALRKCQGMASLWMILGQALPASQCEPIETDRTLVAWLAPLSAAQAISPALDPATPPPRAAR